MGLQTLLRRVGTTRFCGAVWNPAEPDRTFVVELLLDGMSMAIAVADLFEPSLKQAGDGCHGFSFEIDAETLAEVGIAEVRLANLGLPIGLPILLHAKSKSEKASGAGTKSKVEPLGVPPVQWLGGLRFVGALDPADADVYGEMLNVKALIEGEVVAEARPNRWLNNGLLGKDARALAAFDMYLPERFADGCVHRARFVAPSGQPLPGSPVAFVAFADGLATLLAEQGMIESERLRGDIFDQLMPGSLPFSNYKEWCENLSEAIASQVRRRSATGVVLVGDGDENASLSALELQTQDNWVALSLPFCDNAQGFECGALRDFLADEAAACDFIIFAKAGFILSPDAIERFDEAFAAQPQAFIVYCDIAIKDSFDKTWPIAFSAFDYERMLEQGYCGSLFAVKRDALGILSQTKTLNLYRLFNGLVADPLQVGALHIPRSLGTIKSELNTVSAGRALIGATSAHLRSRGIEAKVTLGHSELFPAIKVIRAITPARVTIIIPTRNRVDLLRKCLESIDPAVKKNAADIMIVDNESSDPETLAFLAEFPSEKRQVLRVPGEFNFSKLNNLAAKAAQTDYLCLLNNDIQALDAFWLGELLSRCGEQDVAAVGALLVWPSGVVQHGGVVLGSSFGATHAFNDRLSSDSGYADSLLVAHECSAVTAACLLTRRADYLAVGGLDEIFFPINFNDVDYCLKLRARGKRIIFTPHAKLLHLESASRGDHQSDHRKALFKRELRSLRTRWMEVLLADPYYSPALSLDPVPFSALAWPLRAMVPRWRSLPVKADIPPGM
jgi:GT2 family glycosyltransferase